MKWLEEYQELRGRLSREFNEARAVGKYSNQELKFSERPLELEDILKFAEAIKMQSSLWAELEYAAEHGEHTDEGSQMLSMFAEWYRWKNAESLPKAMTRVFPIPELRKLAEGEFEVIRSDEFSNFIKNRYFEESGSVKGYWNVR